MKEGYELSDSEDETMQDMGNDEDNHSKFSSVEEEKKSLQKQQELEEAAQYYEPIDLTKEGMYPVKAFDANTEKWRWRADFKTMSVKQYSPDLVVGPHSFRLLVFPKGNQVPFVSLYLDTNNASDVKLVRFQISMLNQKDIRESHSQDAEKKFGPNDVDWGFKEFVELKKMNPESGLMSSEGIVYFEIVIHICTQPYLIDPISYDSRKETGFVGLQNQGATCYMNSLLQTLYLLTYFRKSVYKMPIDETEKPQDSIPLALMRVFYRLQFDKGAVDTKELTKSFGWDTIDSFLQHDVQELARVLIENLEKKMEKTDQKEVMKQLFEGTCKNYIKCINVDYESSRQEPFYDLQLNVKGCKNVTESFDQYILEETLQGENQYQAEGLGLQDAKKGTNFLKFPPVLMLHLKRFEYDYQRDLMYKINDRYEFPLEIDLGKYLNDDSPQKNEDNTYVLFSVLVHSGDVSGGHYYNFAKPFVNEDRWFKFDDEKVYEVNEGLAVQDNFGGEAKKSKMFWLSPNSNSIYKKFTNAYMLLYIRKSEVSQMIAQVEIEEIPTHLEERFQKDRDERERKKKEKLEAAKYCHIKIVTDEDLKTSIEKHGAGLVEFDEVEPMKFLREGTFGELKDNIHELHNIKPEHQRFWKWQKRQNHTLRPDAIIKASDDNTPIDKKYPYLKLHQGPGVELYLETSKQSYIKKDEDGDEQTVWFPEPPSRYNLLFIKEYDPVEKKLFFVGTIYADTTQTIAQFIPSLKKLINAQETDEIEIVEEIKPKMIESVNINRTFKEAQLQSGDILTVQKIPANTDLSQFEIPNAKAYYDYLNNRVSVEIRKLEEPQKTVITIELLKNMEYKEVSQRLGVALNVDGQYIRLTGHNPYSEVPLDQPFRTNAASNTLREMINIGQTSSPFKILYYEILDEPIHNVENKKELIVTWVNTKCQEVEKFKFLLYPDQKIADLRQLVEAKVNGRREVENSTILLSYVSNFKINKIFSNDDELIKSIANNKGEGIRAEEMSLEETTIWNQASSTEEYRLLQVQHICKETSGYRLFGNPMFLITKREETLGEVKKRLQEKMQVRDIDFKRYKFFFVVSLKIKDALEEDDLPFNELYDKEKSPNNEVILALEHKDPTPKARWYEKPIVIKN